MFTVLFMGALLSPATADEGCLDPFGHSASWALPSGRLTLDRGILQLNDRLVAAEVESVDVVGDHVVYVQHRTDGLLRDLIAFDATTARSLPLTVATTPSQPALSADGERVAFVDGRTGLTSLWLQGFDGSAVRQLTNVDVRRVVGRAPEGFVPSPDAGDLSWSGDTLTWTAEGRRHTLDLASAGGDR